MYKLSPSKAHRYLNCTKSLEFDTEFVSSPWTIRGNILHEYGEMKIKELDTRIFEEEHQFNDYEEFLINAYVSAVWNEYNLIMAKSIHVEEKEPMTIFGHTFNFLIDVLILAETIASVIDLKSGNGDVSPEDNEQLLLYGYSQLIKFPKIELLRLSIFQKGKMKTEEYTRDEVFDYFISKYEVYEAIEKNELTYNPSEKACKFCGNKEKCMARAKWILERE